MTTTETILSRMMSDADFANAVFTNAEKTLAEYNLPAEEIAKFKSLSRGEFASMDAEERKSFGGYHGIGGTNHNEILLNA